LNCIREAENYLRYYRELSKSVEHADRVIGKLMNQTAPRIPSAVAMDLTGIRAPQPHDTLNQIYQLQKWQEMKEQTLIEMEKVDEVLNVICQDSGCERYKEVLVMWYVVKMDKDEIADKFSYSSRQSVYDMKNRAIKKFAVALFGVTALKAI
jgi:hypothetical protein